MLRQLRVCVVMLLPALAFAGCDSKDGEPERQAALMKAAREQEQERAVSAMAAKHNAVQNWKDNLSSGLTIHLQEALVRTDGRPVVVHAWLVDVLRDDVQCRAVFESTVPLKRYVGYGIAFVDSVVARWVLDCDLDQAKQLIARDAEKSGNGYCMIALASSVNRAVFEVRAEAELEDDGACGRVSIENGDVVLIRGRLSAFVAENAKD